MTDGRELGDGMRERLQHAVSGRYIIMDPIAGGGMSAVFLARDEALNRQVVIKVLPHALANGEAVERFRREIATVASLSHPQIVPILAAGDVDGLPYFVMPYVEGESLSRRLGRGPLSVREAVSILVDVARALAFAHERGVVHRDIKPGNILLTADSAVVTDFGIAKARRAGKHGRARSGDPGSWAGAELTSEGTSLGTPAYMAPEQIAGDDDTDARADLYSFGVVGYEMLVGAPPFAASTRRQILSAHLVETPQPISKRRQDVPPGLERVITQCLAKDPSARPRGAMDIVRTLQDPIALASMSADDRGPAAPADRSLRVAGGWDRVRSAVLGDLRHGARGLIRVPTIALSALLCLGLGSGATLTVFSAIDRALLRPLPFAHGGELVSVYRTTPRFNGGPLSAPSYVDLTRSVRGLDSLAAMATASGHLSLGAEATTVRVVRVSGTLFPDLGVRAIRGRLLGSEDAIAGAPPVALVSAEFWRSQFGSDASLVGRTVALDGVPTTVVGILPDEFRVPHGTAELGGDVWIPLKFSAAELGTRESNFLNVLGRRAPGSTVASAEAELVGLMAGLTITYPNLQGESLQIVPIADDGAAYVRAPLMLLFGAVCIVLLIAAGNVVCLLLARGVRRERETAIRAAVGGSRWAVVRPIVAESAILAVVGIALGCVLAWLSIRLIGTRAGDDVPQLAQLSLGVRVIPVAFVLAIVVTVLAGALPAWHSAGIDPQHVLRTGGTGGAGRDRNRPLASLVVVEVALSLMLLLGAGLTLRGFVRLLDQDSGFDRARLLTVEAAVSPLRYSDNSSGRAFLQPVLAAIARLPGVDAAGAISVMPIRDWGYNSNIRYEGQSAERISQLPLSEQRVVTPDFYRVTRQRLLAGRGLRDADAEPNAPAVVVVNQALVARDFPGRDPIGKRFYTSDTSLATIVGVVSSISNAGPHTDARAEIDFPYPLAGDGTTVFNLVIRVARGDPAAMTAAVRTAIRSIDSQAAITRIAPMPQVFSESLRRQRFFLTLICAFAGTAVVLALSGLYGVLSYVVAQRTRELGIRTALGSTPAQIVVLVARRGMALAVIGVVCGLVGGVAITRLLGSLLFGVSPLDHETWILATVSLLAASTVATIVPSLRAATVDPLRAIRAD